MMTWANAAYVVLIIFASFELKFYPEDFHQYINDIEILFALSKSRIQI